MQMVSNGNEGWRAYGPYDTDAPLTYPFLNWMNSGLKGTPCLTLIDFHFETGIKSHRLAPHSPNGAQPVCAVDAQPARTTALEMQRVLSRLVSHFLCSELNCVLKFSNPAPEVCCCKRTGEDFKRNLQIADLDFATIHVYPSNWGVPTGTCLSWVNNDWIGDRAALATAAGKPLVLEVSQNLCRGPPKLGLQMPCSCHCGPRAVCCQ